MRYYDDDENPEPRMASERMGESEERKLRHRSLKEDKMDPKYRAPFPIGGPMTALIVVGLVLYLTGLFFIYLLGVISNASSDLRNWFVFIGQIAWTVGTLMVSGPLILTAMKKNGISPAVRVGLIIAGIVVLVYMLRSIPVTTYFPW